MAESVVSVCCDISRTIYTTLSKKVNEFLCKLKEGIDFCVLFKRKSLILTMMKSRMFQKRTIANLVFAGLVGGLVSLFGFYALAPQLFKRSNSENYQTAANQMARYAALSGSPGFDFTGVAEIANPAVVHIKTTSGGSQSRQPQGGGSPFDPFEFFNGPGFRFDSPGPRMASGSGVIYLKTVIS